MIRRTRLPVALGVLLLLILVSAVIGIQKVYAQEGSPIITNRPKIKIINPSVVAVHALERQRVLKQASALNMCSRGYSLAPVLNDLKAPKGYGLDERYNRISASFRALGASCLGGNKSACERINNSALDWARNSKLGKPKGIYDSSLFWNETLSINMRLLSPMLAALGVANQFTPLASEERKVLDDWLRRKTKQFKNGLRNAGKYRGGSHGTTARRAANNHAVQSSIAAMSYGAWANEPKFFKTGITQWFITLGSMRKDGSLPIETRRGARALFYSGRTIAGLLQLAERAAVQGINLYERAPRRNKTIHHAVAFFVNAIEQPDLILKYARINYEPGPSENWQQQHLGNVVSTFGWVAPYISRFPNHPNSQRLLALKLKTNTQPQSYLLRSLTLAVIDNGYSGEWIGVDARCFYASPRLD